MINLKSNRLNKKRKLYNQSKKFKIKLLLKTMFPTKSSNMEIKNSTNRLMGIKINSTNLTTNDLITTTNTINKDLITTTNTINKDLITTTNTINKGLHMIKLNRLINLATKEPNLRKQAETRSNTKSNNQKKDIERDFQPTRTK
jgi:hypothetical protein